jgi:hypothetical protein
MVRSLILAIFVMSLVSGNVYAHGTAIYVSTPVSAPLGFGWVAWISAFILIVAHAVLLKRFRQGSRQSRKLYKGFTL